MDADAPVLITGYLDTVCGVRCDSIENSPSTWSPVRTRDLSLSECFCVCLLRVEGEPVCVHSVPSQEMEEDTGDPIRGSSCREIEIFLVVASTRAV